MPSKVNNKKSPSGNGQIRILGIDPGYDRLGIAVIEKDPSKKKEVVLYSSHIQTSAKESIYSRLKIIGESVRRVINEYSPNALSIENLFLANNQKTAMRVSEARGIIIYEACLKDIPIFEYTPMQIKMAITGDGSSDKDRMIKMVHLLVELPPKKRMDDEYDAIATALTHSALTKSPLSKNTH